ncbi:MAG: threonylcarbamoyl-AMP synthase [Flavobacteriales bacterium]|nr:threonylcarbamoyl-AMP synthase [Flavobacteriales bacterium]MCB9198029.1 threonylcarbamoyl-AMP synthase [Flavobacteriales bacterium]
MEIAQEALNILKNGGVILYNTDTIPGLGCDATDATAIERIFDIKNRPANKSLIVLVANDGMLQRYVEEVPEVAWDIIDFTDKPTTIIYPRGKNLAQSAMAEDGSIGIRVIKEGPLHQLIMRLGKPLVSTSANLSGDPSPQNLSEISHEIISKVDLVVDLPTNKTHKASSIIKIELNGEFKIIRK